MDKQRDLQQLYDVVDSLLSRSSFQCNNIDADLAAAKGRVDRFLKIKDKNIQFDIDLNVKLFKSIIIDLKKLVDGGAFARKYGDEEKYSSIKETLALFIAEFNDVVVLVDDNEIVGIVNIVEELHDVDSVKNFYTKAPSKTMNISHTQKEDRNDKYCEDKKVIKAIVRRAKGDTILVDNFARLKTRQEKLLKDYEFLMCQLSGANDKKLRNEYLNAFSLVKLALRNNEERLQMFVKDVCEQE